MKILLEEAERLSSDAPHALGHHAAQLGRRLLADIRNLESN
jgi:hypothetical protein